jgi:S1-C subfamily serine protease
VYSDLATLRPESVPESATPLPLAEGSAQVGQEVVAIGNPLGYSGSVTSGIVSGVDRALPSPTGFQIPDAIQTDAPVNPGNSGGPLVSLDGTVLGVINSGGGDNIGFAISAALMSRVVPALARSGSYDHPYMGVALTNVTPLIAEANDLDPASGVYIDAVRGGGPTDGVLEGSTGETTVGGRRVPTGGDVVDALAGEQTPTTQGLASALALETTPGEPTDITFRRDGRRQSRTFRVGTRPEA